MYIPAWMANRPFAYLGVYMQIEPLFRVGDKVRPQHDITRACGNQWRLQPLNRGIYTVQSIKERGKPFDDYGFQIQLCERPGIWYRAWDFIRAGLTGWVGPASDLGHVYTCGVYQWQHIYLPCVHCGAPNQWMPKAYYFGGFKCWNCRKRTCNHGRTRAIEKIFVEIIGRYSFSPGQRVKPRANWQDTRSLPDHDNPGISWPDGSALVSEIWRPHIGPGEFMRCAQVPGVWDPWHFQSI